MVLTGCDQHVCSKPHYIIFNFFLPTIGLFFDSETIPSHSKEKKKKKLSIFQHYHTNKAAEVAFYG